MPPSDPGCDSLPQFKAVRCSERRCNGELDATTDNKSREVAVENVWWIAALWIGLALAASLLSVWLTISVALTEIVVGAVAGNLIHLQLNDWINWLAGFGAILLTFLAGVEIE